MSESPLFGEKGDNGGSQTQRSPFHDARVMLLRTATAALAFSAVASLIAAYVCIHSSVAASRNDEALVNIVAAAISGIATVHYAAILALRVKTKTEDNVEVTVHTLRYGDWLLTMPLLVYKFYLLFEADCAPSDADAALPQGGVLPSVLALVMVALGAFVVLGNGFSMRAPVAYSKIAIVLTALSCALLAVLLHDLFANIRTCHDHQELLLSFCVVWIGYVVVFAFELIPSLRGPVARDAGYAVLDVYSKATFGLFTASLACR